jgi:hypothetical protein
MVQGLMQHLIEADRVNEKTSVYSIDAANLDIYTVQEKPINRVPLQRQFLCWLKDHAWNV